MANNDMRLKNLLPKTDLEKKIKDIKGSYNRKSIKTTNRCFN